jgi:glycosyltransferase involved in cell wall biosynthesis
MKVVFVMTLGERLSGAENYLWTFLEHADRERVEPVCACVEGTFRRDVAALGIRTPLIWDGRLRHVRSAGRIVRRLAQIIRAESPDLVVPWVPKAQVYTGAAAALTGYGTRNVWWTHDFHGGRLADRLATALPATAVVGCSRAVAEEQAALWPHRRCLFLHPGIEDPRAPARDALRALRARLGIPDGRVVVGNVGRMIHWKGQGELVEAIARLLERGLDVHGLLVGGDAYGLDPGYGPAVRARAAELGLTGRITFTDHVDNPLDHLALMDVFVSASPREPFGIVLLEAMALGIPVVAVGEGGPREIVEDGRSGLLTAGAGAPALAGGAQRLIADRDLAGRLAAGGRERFLARFTAKRMVGELHDLLAGLAAPGSVAPPAPTL